MVPNLGSTPLTLPIDKIAINDAMDLEMSWTRLSVLFISKHTRSRSGDNPAPHTSNCSCKISLITIPVTCQERALEHRDCTESLFQSPSGFGQEIC